MAIVQRHSLRAGSLLSVAALVAVLAGCSGTPSASGGKNSGSGSSGVPSQAQAAKQVGKITLTVLDQEVTPAGKIEFPAMIKSFEKQYPNITIKRLTRDFNSLTSNETLLLSGNNVPDVVEDDEGYPNQGRLVKANLVLPLEKYATAWGWKSRTSSGLMACCRIQSTGKGLGTGPLYGFPFNSQYVGVFYNQRLLSQLGLKPPTTRAEFETALAKAKAAGMVPIIGSGGDHDLVWWGYYLTMGMNVPPDQIRAALLGQGKGFNTPQMTAAANEFASWGQKGYFEPGFGGLTSDQTTPMFQKGKGLFYAEGSWDLGAFKDSPDIRFMPEPALTSGALRTGIGAAGQPWAIPAKGKHPLAAALWIDWISSPRNAKVLVNAGDLPIEKVDTSKFTLTPVQKDTFQAGAYMNTHNTALPFFWAIPQALNYWQGAGGGILSGHVTGQQFVKGLQQGWHQDVAQFSAQK